MASSHSLEFVAEDSRRMKEDELKKIATGIDIEEEEVEEVMDWPDKQSLRSALECPVCYNVPFGDIYMCLGGHYACKYCLDRLPGKEQKTCPICKVDLPIKGPTCRRNFAVEELVRSGIFSCPRGCKVIRKGNMMAQHLDEECGNRDIICPFCLESGDQNNYCGVKALTFIQHLKEHGVTGSMMEKEVHTFQRKFNLNLNSSLRKDRPLMPDILKFDGEFFLLRFRYQRQSFGCDMLLIWVEMIGGKGEAKNYRAVVKFKNLVQGSTITWNIPVFSIRENKAPSLGDSGSLTLDQLQGFSAEFSLKRPFFDCKLMYEVSMVRRDGR